jgi:outer membrane protein TolC
MDVSLSYGREMLASEVFNRLWTDPKRERSYTVAVDAYLPIWDWGERKARIASSQIGLDQTLLRREEVENQIVSNVRNEVRNVEEYQSRTLAMQENLELARAVAESSFIRYEQGAITALDLIQSLRREADTAQNFLDTYLGWRRALLRLQELTFFDFEEGMPVLDRFGVEATPPDWN